MSRVVLLHASRQAAVWLIFDVRQNKVKHLILAALFALGGGDYLPPTKSAPAPSTSDMTVFVSGAVRKPGSVTISKSAKVWDAITQAGGPTTPASLSKIKLIRYHDDEVANQTLDLTAKAVSPNNIPLRDHDAVVVPQKLIP